MYCRSTLECPTEEYKEIDDDSDYCYKIVSEKETLKKAKEKCAKDDAILVCLLRHGNDVGNDLLTPNLCPLLCQITSQSNSTYGCNQNAYSDSYICQKEKFPR